MNDKLGCKCANFRKCFPSPFRCTLLLTECVLHHSLNKLGLTFDLLVINFRAISRCTWNVFYGSHHSSWNHFCQKYTQPVSVYHTQHLWRADYFIHQSCGLQKMGKYFFSWKFWWIFHLLSVKDKAGKFAKGWNLISAPFTKSLVFFVSFQRSRSDQHWQRLCCKKN